MIQNLKNFLIAFVTGLVVFGICAIFIINYLEDFDLDKTSDEPQTETSQQAEESKD